MTSILLHLLECFDGVLFITSNRVSSFDTTALSRITLAIKYQNLNDNSKSIVWRNALIRVFAGEKDSNGLCRSVEEATEFVDKEFNCEELGKFNGSGRSIWAIIKLAIGLADDREVSLSYKVLCDTMNIFIAFNDDFKKEGVPTTWD